MKTIMIIDSICDNCGSYQLLQWPHNVQYCRTCGIALVKKGVKGMCIKMYKTTRNIAKVVVCEFDRQTETMLVRNGKRVAKRGTWENYYTTYEEAKDELIRKAMLNVKGCTLRLSEAETFLHKTQAMTNDPDYTLET